MSFLDLSRELKKFPKNLKDEMIVRRQRFAEEFLRVAIAVSPRISGTYQNNLQSSDDPELKLLVPVSKVVDRYDFPTIGKLHRSKGRDVSKPVSIGAAAPYSDSVEERHGVVGLALFSAKRKFREFTS